MGFESRISGYIASTTNAELNRNQLFRAIRNHIEALPELSDDKWPFLPREVFSISMPNEGTNYIPISYRSIIVHFGMSVKQMEGELDVWLDKYEKFMKSMPGVWESLVNIQLTPHTGNFTNKHMSYWWCKEFLSKSSETIWKYQGDPRSWDELSIRIKNETGSG